MDVYDDLPLCVLTPMHPWAGLLYQIYENESLRQAASFNNRLFVGCWNTPHREAKLFSSWYSPFDMMEESYVQSCLFVVLFFPFFLHILNFCILFCIYLVSCFDCVYRRGHDSTGVTGINRAYITIVCVGNFNLHFTYFYQIGLSISCSRNWMAWKGRNPVCGFWQPLLDPI